VRAERKERTRKIRQGRKKNEKHIGENWCGVVHGYVKREGERQEENKKKRGEREERGRER
jgi:hypothetical protein